MVLVFNNEERSEKSSNITLEEVIVAGFFIACIMSGTFGEMVHRFFPRVSFNFKMRTILWEMKVNSHRSLFYRFHIKWQLGTLLLVLLLLLLRQITKKIKVIIMSVDIWCEHMKYAYLYRRLESVFNCMILAVFSFFFLSSSERGLKNSDMNGTQTLTIAMLVQFSTGWDISPIITIIIIVIIMVMCGRSKIQFWVPLHGH